MRTRRDLLSVIAALLLLGLSAIALADHRAPLRTGDAVAQTNAQPLAGQPAAGWVHEGCWSATVAGTCYDIYRDPSGNYWKCSQCGTTKNPGPNKCNQISQQTLNQGFWCS